MDRRKEDMWMLLLWRRAMVLDVDVLLLFMNQNVLIRTSFVWQKRRRTNHSWLFFHFHEVQRSSIILINTAPHLPNSYQFRRNYNSYGRKINGNWDNADFDKVRFTIKINFRLRLIEMMTIYSSHWRFLPINSN